MPVTLFRESQQIKAEVYTWLAWQKRPGYTLDVAVRGEEGHLLDRTIQPFAGLIAWLRRLFPTP